MAASTSTPPASQWTTVVKPALTVGTAAGSCGLLYGIFAGVIRSPSRPAIFAIATTVQAFTLGATFWGSRQLLLTSNPARHDSASVEQTVDPLPASAISGALAGAASSLVRRGLTRRLPLAVLLYGSLGLLGEDYKLFSPTSPLFGHSTSSNTASKTPVEKGNLLARLAGSKFFPMRVLTDEEYEAMLKDKILVLDAELAIIDEDIKKLADEEARMNNDDGKTGKEMEAMYTRPDHTDRQ